MTELKLEIEKFDISNNQIVVAKAPIGGMPHSQARDYLASVTKALDTEVKRAGLEGVACFVFPHQTAPAIEILDPPQPGSKIIFSIPLENLPAKERLMYLKITREELRKSFDLPDCTIEVVPAGTGVTVQQE